MNNAINGNLHLNNSLSHDTLKGVIVERELYPAWVLKFMRRVGRLDKGRYQITLTVDEGQPDWTVMLVGKVEK